MSCCWNGKYIFVSLLHITLNLAFGGYIWWIDLKFASLNKESTKDIQSTASNKLVRAFCLGAVRSLAFAAAKVAISSTAAFILSNVSLPLI